MITLGACWSQAVEMAFSLTAFQSSGMLDRIDTLTAVEIEAAEAQKVQSRYPNVGEYERSG